MNGSMEVTESFAKRFLTSFDTDKLSRIDTDVLVIGSGVAGLRAAIEASRYAKVLIVTKSNLKKSNTEDAQGGIAAVFSEEDSFESHITDTLNVSGNIANEEAVRILVEEAPARINELIGWGAEFDKKRGKVVFGKEAGHSVQRIIHAGGDATGVELERVLASKCRKSKNISILEHAYAIDLLAENEVCYGALVDVKNEQRKAVYARKTIMATGGLGQVYRETTNSSVATGCGISAAYRAGASVLDMEFVQFHPTSLYIAGAARILISETVRGEGAVLKNKYGHRFMSKYHKDKELAPRDIVSRAILEEMKKTGDTHVYLDLSHLNADFLKGRFPNIIKACSDFGLDLKKDLIPVRPTAHYMIGGIRTDLNGRTNLKGLFACGECACMALHGANRLASNSLLEGLVFGQRAGMTDADREKDLSFPRIKSEVSSDNSKKFDIEDIKNALKSLMSRCVGIRRDKASLEEARKEIDFWATYVMKKEFASPEAWQLQNMLTVARLIQSSAYVRDESRGVHYRKDHPRLRRKWDNTHIELAFGKAHEIVSSL